MTRLSACVVAALLSSAACKNDKGPDEPIPQAEYARRAATSFIHCVESGSAGCVKSGEDIGGWDAFFLLGWLADGSPTGILTGLSKELQMHTHPAYVQGRFVQLIERYQPRLRGAECDAVGVQDMAPLIRSVSEVAQQRLGAFGIWTADMQGVVSGLRNEAEQGLRTGFVVRMQCRTDPYQVYVATASRGNRQAIMGITVILPRFLGGEDSNRDSVTGRRRSVVIDEDRQITVQEGTIHTWLPIPVEVF